MKILLPALLFLLLTLPSPGFICGAMAQNGANPVSKVTLSGRVLDGSTSKPVEFATVAIQRPTGQVVTGSVCDAEGQFSIPGLLPGDYVVVVSFLSYQVRRQNLTVAAGAKTVVLPPVSLQPDNQSLKEVSITAQRNLVEETNDGFVYNADQDLTNSGGTAADVLKKIPMLSVDMDGNLELRGSNKIKVLINNKPSAVTASSVAEALQQIPADLIKSVEVITSPSAKYDSEGTAGIINIITKKNTLQGVTGTINAAAGNRNSNLNSNLNIRKNKVGLQLNLGGSHFTSLGNAASEQNFYYTRPTDSGNPDLAGQYYHTRQVSQSSNFENQGRSGYLQASADYDINDKHNLHGGLRLNRSQSVNDRDLESGDLNTATQALSRYQRTIGSDNEAGALDANLNFRKQYARKGQELNLLALYSRNNRENDYQLNQENEASVINYREQNINSGFDAEFTVQADYEHPFKRWGNLEAGAKFIKRRTTSDYLFTSATLAKPEFVVNPNRSNSFAYDQEVYSAYFSQTYKFNPKYTLRLGGRYEFTSVVGDFISTGTHLARPYQNLMPNATVIRTLPKNQRVRVSYSLRIHRPQINYLNPFVNSSNPNNINFGNPNLDPEITHNTEAYYSIFVKRSSFNASAYWRQTNNDINRYLGDSLLVTDLSDSLSFLYATFLNNGRNASYGTNLNGSVRLGEKGQLGSSFNLSYNDIRNLHTGTKRTGLLYSSRINGSYRFNKAISGQVSASYNSGNIQLQSRQSGYYGYSLGLRQELWDRKGALTLNLDNFVFASIQTRSESENSRISTVAGGTDSRILSQSYTNNFNRTLRLGFLYRFGKMEYKKVPERKTINNDDKTKTETIEVTDPKTPAQERKQKSAARKK